MKNLIYIVAIGMDVNDCSKKAWEHYCNRYNIDFKIIDNVSINGMSPHWERYTVMERFPNYDNYIYVDADALVRWDAPNFFDELPYNKLYAVQDIGSLEWTENSIRGYQDMFPDIEVKWWEYFTTGFLKFNNKKHRLALKEFINIHKENIKEFNNRQYKTLRKGFDQTPFNYFVKKEKIELELAPPIYSLAHLQKKDIFHNGMFVELGYIWQFNGFSHKDKELIIEHVWNTYENLYK